MGAFALKSHMIYKKYEDLVESEKHLVAFLKERNS